MGLVLRLILTEEFPFVSMTQIPVPRHGRIQRGTGGPDHTPSEKSQVAIGFLRNAGTDRPREAVDPLGPTVSRGRFVRPSVKDIDGL